MAKGKKEVSFKDLPLDILEKIQDSIQKHHTNKDVTNFSFVSKATLFVSTKRIKQIKIVQAQKLLTHVVRGEEKEVLSMINALPKLLLVKSSATDYSGRTIVGTALQAALGAEDVIMCQKILPYFENLKNGKEEALKQFKEQFPDGLDAEFKKDKETPYNFEPLINTIINGTKGAADEALEKFRAVMTASKEIRQGKHFNMQHLIDAYQAYNNHFDRLLNWDNRDLFQQKVIGYIQGQIPANYAQAYCTGLYSVAKTNKAPGRSLKLYGNKSFYARRLGLDFAIDSGRCWCVGGVRAEPTRGGRAASSRPGGPCSPRRPPRGYLKKYVQQKQTILLQLESSLSKGVLTSRNSRGCCIL